MSHGAVARTGRPADRRLRAVTGQDCRPKPTSWSTSRSRAAWPCATTSCRRASSPLCLRRATASARPRPPNAPTAWPASRADDFRWKKAHIKSISLAGAVLARQMSADVGAAETVMFRDGFLSEGAAANVWVVKDGTRARPAQGQPGAGRHPLRPDRGAVPRGGHPVRAAPRGARRGVRGRRNAAVQRHQGSAAGAPAWTGRLLETASPAPSTRSCTPAISAPKHTSACPPSTHPAPPIPQGIADRVPVALPHQGDGGQGGWFRACGHARSPASSTRPSTPRRVELRDSKAGNYLGVTITVTATSREQLDELYRTLSTHPMVKVVL